MVKWVPASVVLAFLSGPAAALTADEAWAALRNTLERAGTADFGAITRTEDSVTVDDLTITFTAPESSETLTGSLARIELREGADGSVTVSGSDRIELRGSPVAPGADALTGSLALPGARLTISDRASQVQIDLTVPSMTANIDAPAAANVEGGQINLSVTDYRVTGTLDGAPLALVGGNTSMGRMRLDFASLPETAADHFTGYVETAMVQSQLDLRCDGPISDDLFPGGTFNLSWAAQNMKIGADGRDDAGPFRVAFEFTGPSLKAKGQIGAETADGKSPKVDTRLDLDAAMVGYDISAIDPTMAGPTDFVGQIEKLSIAFAALVPADIEALGFGEALRAGLSLSLMTSSKASVSRQHIGADPGWQIDSFGEPTRLEARVSDKGFFFDLNAGPSRYDIRDASMQAPARVSSGATIMRIAFPVLASAAAEPFVLRLALGDITIPEAAWTLFDPEGQLKRDPLSLDIDVTGGVRLMEDIDADNEPSLADDATDVPVDFDRVDLNTLSLSGIGAQIVGSGAVELRGQGESEVPVGALDFQLTGVQQAIAGLSNLGLIDQEMALGIRGALGVGTKAVGPDDLRSTIEFGADGSIKANGLAIQ